MHRVTVTDQHYDLVRQYMVVTKLPHVRAAVERMIEIAAEEAAEGGTGLYGVKKTVATAETDTRGPGKSRRRRARGRHIHPMYLFYSYEAAFVAHAGGPGGNE